MMTPVVVIPYYLKPQLSCNFICLVKLVNEDINLEKCVFLQMCHNSIRYVILCVLCCILYIIHIVNRVVSGEILHCRRQ